MYWWAVQGEDFASWEQRGWVEASTQIWKQVFCIEFKSVTKLHFRKPLKSDCEQLPGFLSPLPSAALVWPLLFFFLSVFHGCCALCPVCSGEVCQAWLASVPGTLTMESSEDQEEDTQTHCRKTCCPPHFHNVNTGTSYILFQSSLTGSYSSIIN